MQRIIVLGDSVVVGLGLRELDDLIPRRLQTLLDPERVEVLGFGAKGYNTRAEVRLLDKRGVRYAPDLVIVSPKRSKEVKAKWGIGGRERAALLAARPLHSPT